MTSGVLPGGPRAYSTEPVASLRYVSTARTRRLSSSELNVSPRDIGAGDDPLVDPR